MRVAINCRSILKPRLTGIGRNTFHLLDWLGRIDQENQYLLYSPKRLLDFKRRAPRFPYSNFSVRLDYWGKGAGHSVGPHDVYHLPSPDTLPAHAAPMVVTIHDLIYKTWPQSHTSQTLETTERHMKGIIARAAMIICPSGHTRQDLHRFFEFPRERSCVVYNGVDSKVFFPLSEGRRSQVKTQLVANGVDRPFILFVSTLEPRKNLGNVLEALSRLKSKKRFTGQLAVAGSQGWMMEETHSRVAKLGLKADVRFLGYVSDEQLCYYYNLADVFVYPSFYEGFGFPIVEAFCCGAAVLTSNVSSCPEIARDAALTVDPNSVEAIAAGLDALLHDVGLKEALQRKALLRAQDFAFEKTARETLAVYKKLARA